MKKTLTLILVAALCSMALTSCVDKTGDNNSQTTSVAITSAEKTEITSITETTSEATLKSDYGSAQNPTIFGEIGVDFYIHTLNEDKILYCGPSEESEPIFTIPQENEIAIIDFSDNFAYCSVGTYYGWIKDMVPDETSRHIPMPDFFDDELKNKFIQAQTLFNAYSSDVAGHKGFTDIDKHLRIEQTGMDVFEDSIYVVEEEILNALRNVFTEEYINDKFMIGTKFPNFVTQNSNGHVMFSSIDRGTWIAEVIDYNLIEKTDDKIEFEVHYRLGEQNDAGNGNVTCVAVKDEHHGWVFSQFTTDRDDINWMEAMGPYFDPWKAIGRA